MQRWAYLFAVVIGHSSFVIGPSAQAAPPLTLNKGDHICIIGNTLAERMQHDGWLETMLHARFPEHELVIRNLGFSGDEITTRLRSAGFGSPDEWLTRCKADVIFAFFGYNESWAGEAGLPKFKQDLDKWIKHTLSQKYNGKSAPRIVLFSPTGHETLDEKNLPKGDATNERLIKYVTAMKETCDLHRLLYVDVSRTLRIKNEVQVRDYSFTNNGIHLDTEHDYIYREMHDKLFDNEVKFNGDHGRGSIDARVHKAVLDKNFYWFQRYRTVDGYSIYGGRADLKFTNGQTNREVMQREMEVLDVMTANRDKKIWAVAQGKEYTVDDSNTPPFIEVITNAPGKGPNGTHLFLGGEEAISKMRLGKNLKINLFASEEKFPELANPVQMTWDAKGRLWVAVWPTYPHWKPKEPMNDKILIFEDTDGDGKADKMTVFADNLHCPTGFELWNGGVIVAQAPDLMFLKDTNGDDKADVRERILHGLDSADTHHTANSFTFDPAGGLYFQEGTFHHTQVETPWGPPVRNANAGVYRYEPRTHKFEVYIAHHFANPHGHVFDRWGQDIVVDGTGSQPYHAALFSGHIDFPDAHKTPPQVYQQRTRPCPGIEYCTSRHFPDDWQGNLLVPNVIGDQGILRYKIEDDGASFKGSELEPIVLSSDPNFRPSDLKIGPDGAIYFIDWHNPIIGHMQHNLRDPSRDRTHGRIYRITYEGRPLSKSPPIAGESIENLLECLKHPEDRVRYRARQELWGRKSGDVITAVERWLRTLNKDDADYEHQRLEALWLYQALNVVNRQLLHEVLDSKSYQARAAAVRVTCYWRDRIDGVMDWLHIVVSDNHPRVKLEAVRAASFVKQSNAIEIALRATQVTHDKFVAFTADETIRSLQRFWRKTIENYPDFAGFRTNAGTRFLFHQMPTDQLLKTLPRDKNACMELLKRAGISTPLKQEAWKELSRTNPSWIPLIAAMRDVSNDRDNRDDLVVFELVPFFRDIESGESLSKELIELTNPKHKATVRQAAYLAITAVDGSVDRVCNMVKDNTNSKIDLFRAVPQLANSVLKRQLCDFIAAVLQIAETTPELFEAGLAALASVRQMDTHTLRIALANIDITNNRRASIQSLLRVPRASWPVDQAPRLIENMLAILRKSPPADRTKPEAINAFEFADALTTLLPADQAAKYRKELQALGVRVIRIGTLPERMSYDKEFVAVQAGKPVEIIFDNIDAMPHNLVIGQPGSLEELGMQAEATATDADAPKRNYVPKSKKILLASRLVQPNESQRLTFNAPKEPGIYPIVCTYPGHWRVMHAALYVVPDLEKYSVSPESYLAANPLPVSDPLLKDRRPRTEWKFEELADAVTTMKQGRNYANGKQLFQTASCSSCHQLEKVGNNYGPDLTQLDKTWGGKEILKDMLAPSERINEKFQSYVFTTDKGKIITGLILEEKDDQVKIIENPLSKAEPVVLRKSEIESKDKSPTSLMPKGLLDKLSKEEILDLVAYVLSKGNSESELFHKAGHQHGKPK